MTISFLVADMDNDVTNSPLQPILLMGRYQKEATNLAQTFSSPLNSTKIRLFQTIFKITIATQNNIQSLFLKKYTVPIIQYSSLLYQYMSSSYDPNKYTNYIIVLTHAMVLLLTCPHASNESSRQ